VGGLRKDCHFMFFYPLATSHQYGSFSRKLSAARRKGEGFEPSAPTYTVIFFLRLLRRVVCPPTSSRVRLESNSAGTLRTATSNVIRMRLRCEVGHFGRSHRTGPLCLLCASGQDRLFAVRPGQERPWGDIKLPQTGLRWSGLWLG